VVTLDGLSEAITIVGKNVLESHRRWVRTYPRPGCWQPSVRCTTLSSPRRGAGVPPVQDESGDDHEGEENVEWGRDRKVWKDGLASVIPRSYIRVDR